MPEPTPDAGARVPPTGRSEAPLGARLRFGYGVADAGASLSYGATNTWLLFYLVNAVGLEPLTAGAVFVLGRGADALLDPWMGRWLDRAVAAGRVDRVRLLRRWALPLGGAFALMWALPEGAPAALALLPFLAYSALFTVVQVPYLSLTPDLAPGYHARTELTGVRVAFSIVASLVAAALPPLVVVAAAGGGALAVADVADWRVLGLLLGVATALPYLASGALLRDPRRSPEASRVPNAPSPAAAPRTGSDLATAFGDAAFRSLLAIFVLITLGLMVVSSMLPFYLEGALGLAAGEQTAVLGLLFGSAALAFPLWSRLSAARGKRTALVAALALLAAADLALVGFAPPGRLGPTLLALAAVAGAGLAGAMMLPWAILPDLVDRDAARLARRRDGFLYALFTFAQKGAGSLGVFANGLAATLVGWVAGAAAQPAGAVAGIRFMVGPAAALLFAAAALLALVAPLGRDAHRDAHRDA